MTMESHVTNTFRGDRQPLETLKVAVMVPRSVDHETKQVRSRDVKKRRLDMPALRVRSEEPRGENWERLFAAARRVRVFERVPLLLRESY